MPESTDLTPEDLTPEDLTPEERDQLDNVESRLAELRADLNEIEAAALADDATIDLTLEEVAALADALAMSPPAPVRFEISTKATQPGWSARLDTARRGLQARHLVDDDGRPVGPVARMLILFDEPVFVGHVDLEIGNGAYEFHLCADEEASGEIVALASGLHRFSILPLDQFAARLVVRSGLMARPHEPGSITLGIDDFVALVDAVAAGEDPEAWLCDHAGADPTTARRYLAAARERLASAVVTVLRCSAPQVLEGGSLSWLDGGPHGLWRLPDQEETLGGPDDEIEIKAVSADDLLTELASYLGIDPDTD